MYGGGGLELEGGNFKSLYRSLRAFVRDLLLAKHPAAAVSNKQGLALGNSVLCLSLCCIIGKGFLKYSALPGVMDSLLETDPVTEFL